MIKTQAVTILGSLVVILSSGFSAGDGAPFHRQMRGPAQLAASPGWRIAGQRLSAYLEAAA
jgi:hypothetical protein